jgi:hypothetical protein
MLGRVLGLMVLGFFGLYFFSFSLFADDLYEVSGSPFATEGAPIEARIKSLHEKVIIIDPNEHVYGAYNAEGRLIRWGIASAGKERCEDTGEHCHTHTGNFRIYFLGNADCFSRKYNDASMPYCMFFNGGEAIHGSSGVEFQNNSHGCVRVHISDAEWLRYHFVEGPTVANQYLGTLVIVRPYF